MNAYISAQDAHEFTFFRIPKALVGGPRYRSVSADAKLLYALLLDRLTVSLLNGWQDERGDTFIYYAVTAVQTDLNCSKGKACKLLWELETAELIERHPQGQGKSNRIYLRRLVPVENSSERSKNQTTCIGERSENQTGGEAKRFKNQTTCPEERSENQTTGATGEARRSENRTAGGSKNEPQAVQKPDPNKNKENNNSLIIDRSSEPTIEEQIKEQIEYETLTERYPADTLNCMVNLIAEAEQSKAPTLRINKEDMPREKVRQRFLELDRFHIEYIFDCLEESEPNIRNPRGYFLTALYRAPETMDAYYAAKVAHDEAKEKIESRAA